MPSGINLNPKIRTTRTGSQGKGPARHCACQNDVKHMCKFSVVRPIGGESKKKPEPC